MEWKEVNTFFILKTDRFTLDINIKVNSGVEVREKDWEWTA